MIPVKKADMPEIPIRNTGIVNKRPLVNERLSRRPEATKKANDIINTRKAKNKPVDHLPRRVIGIKRIFIG